MVSHHASADIPALQDSSGGHAKEIYQPSTRMSRLPNHHPPLDNSMLAYTQRVREIAQFRHDSAVMVGAESESPASGVAFSDAHATKGEIMKKRTLPKPQHHYHHKHRRPHSLDELAYRPGKKDETFAANVTKKKDRRFSVPARIPPTSNDASPRDRDTDRDKERVHISFVSASDLFDLVSFSLRSKTSRGESLKQARYEDSLRLIKESNFFGSFPSREALLKPLVGEVVEEEEREVGDKDSLMVQGIASPRDVQIKGKWGSKSGDKLRGEKEKDEEDLQSEEDDKDASHSGHKDPLDLLRDMRFLLLPSHKTRYRPKRVKRMTLPRSLLSVIPEDGRRQQEATTTTTQAQEVFPPTTTTRRPVIPSSSSLSAIKSTRKSKTTKTGFTEIKTPFHETESSFPEGSTMTTGFNETRASFPETKMPFPETRASFLETKTSFHDTKTSFEESKTPNNNANTNARDKSSNDHTPRLDSSQQNDKESSTIKSRRNNSTSLQNSDTTNAIRSHKTSSRSTPLHNSDKTNTIKSCRNNSTSLQNDVNASATKSHNSTSLQTSVTAKATSFSDATLKKRLTPREDQQLKPSQKKTTTSPRRQTHVNNTSWLSGQSLFPGRMAGVRGPRAHNGQSLAQVAPTASIHARARAQRKFRKLIFLRDQLDHEF